ncbi:MAG: hypothetical protein ABSF98_26985 [Bryobacteraceae bacterium]
MSYSLLDVGEDPTDEQIRVFEDISFTLRISNGTFRTTFRARFCDVDAVAMRWMERFFPAGAELRVEDRAVSHGLTSWEWAEQLFPIFPRARFEASDILLYLIRLSLAGGETFIAEPDGRPLQYTRPPFVVSLQHPEPRKYPLNRLLAARAKRRFRRLALPAGWTETSGAGGYQVSRIPCIHPQALALARRNPGFQFRARSVFDATPGSCHVLRTMNIFNKSYFSAEQLAAGASAAFRSLLPGGLWIVGRTLEEDFSNHATFLRRGESGWEVLERIGAGSEMEELALGASR